MAKQREPFESMFTSKGLRAVGDAYRDQLGGPPFPITRNPPTFPEWYCELSGCTRMRRHDGDYDGTCSGYCCCD